MKYIVLTLFALSFFTVFGQNLNRPQPSGQTNEVFRNPIPGSGSSTSSQSSSTSTNTVHSKPKTQSGVSLSGEPRVGDCDLDCQLQARRSERIRYASKYTAPYTSTGYISPQPPSSSADRGSGHFFAALIVGLIGIIAFR